MQMNGRKRKAARRDRNTEVDLPIAHVNQRTGEHRLGGRARIEAGDLRGLCSLDRVLALQRGANHLSDAQPGEREHEQHRNERAQLDRGLATLRALSPHEAVPESVRSGTNGTNELALTRTRTTVPSSEIVRPRRSPAGSASRTAGSTAPPRNAACAPRTAARSTAAAADASKTSCTAAATTSKQTGSSTTVSTPACPRSGAERPCRLSEVRMSLSVSQLDGLNTRESCCLCHGWKQWLLRPLGSSTQSGNAAPFCDASRTMPVTMIGFVEVRLRRRTARNERWRAVRVNEPR